MLCPRFHLLFLPFSLFVVNVSRLVFNRFVKTDQDTTRFLFAQRSVHFALFFFYTVFHCFFSVCCFCCSISVSASVAVTVSVSVSGCLRNSCKTIFEDLRRNCFKLFDFVARCLQLDCAPLPLPLPHVPSGCRVKQEAGHELHSTSPGRRRGCPGLAWVGAVLGGRVWHPPPLPVDLFVRLLRPAAD